VEFVRCPTGASEGSVADIERVYGVNLPPDLRAFWLDSDGPILWFGFKELQFFRVSEVLQDIYSVRKHMAGALPLCMDGNGNICLARFIEGRVCGYYVTEAGVLEWETAALISEDFVGFINDGQSSERRLDA
jgi:hypothetical protein